ncbi:Retrovirus-related Pol polyprotein from transposon TNT 1-94 [Araneus ventricosus]|uniref:Retrovirus-related Pol polyprotein from transposon TNT 1-94 n=1 Tax=Araneus ventricosus TaxID=182803 RepID=A0A4Y2KCI6_ARAVE|nr:Retrovirus-related Pol polyprotein from transposon TNT 1-94 [Araneus ventricosus]
MGNEQTFSTMRKVKKQRLRSLKEVKDYCSENKLKFQPDIFNFKATDTYSGTVSGNYESSSSMSSEWRYENIVIHKNYHQAIKSRYKDKWLEAMQDELQTMKDRKDWKLQDLTDKSKVLGCCWVFFSIKRDDKNKIKHFKARLVAQSLKQRKGESFDEVYSPVVNFGIIRIFFAMLVCLNKWLHLHCDVKCAYLYAPLKEQIFMKQPPGFEQNPKLVYRLQKALYGLHQSGRAWYFEIHKILGELGFKKFNWCNCSYIFNKYVVLLLYVDDIILFGNTESWIHKAVALLKRKFDLKILGKTNKLLSVEFLEDNRNLYIQQSEYISKLCKSYKKYKFPVSSLPISKGVIFSKTQCPQNNSELEEMCKIPYRSLVVSSYRSLVGK